MAFGVWVVADVLVEATASGNARTGWEILALVVGVCAGLAAARAIRWQRRRRS
jgi:hypothetical protein